MKNFLPILIFFWVIIFWVFSSPVLAQESLDSNDSGIPEKNGVYNDPKNPNIKVKVLVHKEKSQQVVSPLLVCSLPDPDSATPVAAAGWHLPSTWSYNLNQDSVPFSVSSLNLPTISGNGFTDWEVASGNKVTFTRGSNTLKVRSSYDLQNIIAWGRTSGTTLGVTYVRYYPSSGLVVDVDTILNKKVPWSWANSSDCTDQNSYDVEDILTHEIGHWLGTDDEYDAIFKDATMFGYASRGEVKKNTLTTGDSAGAFSIYNP